MFPEALRPLGQDARYSLGARGRSGAPRPKTSPPPHGTMTHQQKMTLCLRAVRPGGESEVKRPSGREWGSVLFGGSARATMPSPSRPGVPIPAPGAGIGSIAAASTSTTRSGVASTPSRPDGPIPAPGAGIVTLAAASRPDGPIPATGAGIVTLAAASRPAAPIPTPAVGIESSGQRGRRSGASLSVSATLLMFRRSTATRPRRWRLWCSDG